MATLRGFVNNFHTQLNGAILSGWTNLVVDDDTALNTILATDIDYVVLTIDDGTNSEIVHCLTADGAGNITVTRAHEGTTAVGFADNVTVEARLTRDGLKQINEWEPVEVRTLTGTSSSEDFTLVDGSYKLVFDQVLVTTGAVDIHLQQGTGGGPTIQTTLYDYGGRVGAQATDTTNQGVAASQIVIFPGATNPATDDICGELIISNVDTSLKHTVRYSFHQLDKDCVGAGVRDAAEIVTAIRVKPSSSTFASGSKFILYKRTN